MSQARTRLQGSVERLDDLASDLSVASSKAWKKPATFALGLAGGEYPQGGHGRPKGIVPTLIGDGRCHDHHAIVRLLTQPNFMPMTRYLDLPFSALSEEFAAGRDVPGSGSAAAAGAAIAASLVVTVAKLTVGKADSGTPAQQERYGPFRSRAADIWAEAERHRKRLLEIVECDAVYFAPVVETRRRRDAESDSGKKKELDRECQAALRRAAEFPVEVAELGAVLTDMAVELVERGFQGASGDSGVAAMLGAAAVSGACCVSALNASVLKFDRAWVSKQCKRCLVLRRRMRRAQARAALLAEHQLLANS